VNEGFGARLAGVLDGFGHLCVGIDPSAAALAAWGLEDTPASLETYSGRLIEAAAGPAPLVKVQAAFFERHGAAGVAVLERVLAACRQAGVISILDVKRGDIGSTMDGYAATYFGPAAPMPADAVTLSPYLGFGSLERAIALAQGAGQGVFVLALTSNPDGAAVQQARRADGLTVAQAVLTAAGRANRGQNGPGSVGVVIGATLGALDEATAKLVRELGGPILAPGLGAQGASPDDLAGVFGEAYAQVVAPASRAIASAGPSLAALLGRIENLQAELGGAGAKWPERPV